MSYDTKDDDKSMSISVSSSSTSQSNSPPEPVSLLDRYRAVLSLFTPDYSSVDDDDWDDIVVILLPVPRKGQKHKQIRTNRYAVKACSSVLATQLDDPKVKQISLVRVRHGDRAFQQKIVDWLPVLIQWCEWVGHDHRFGLERKPNIENEDKPDVKSFIAQPPRKLLPYDEYEPPMSENPIYDSVYNHMRTAWFDRKRRLNRFDVFDVANYFDIRLPIETVWHTLLVDSEKIDPKVHYTIEFPPLKPIGPVVREHPFIGQVVRAFLLGTYVNRGLLKYEFSAANSDQGRHTTQRWEWFSNGVRDILIQGRRPNHPEDMHLQSLADQMLQLYGPIIDEILERGSSFELAMMNSLLHRLLHKDVEALMSNGWLLTVAERTSDCETDQWMHVRPARLDPEATTEMFKKKWQELGLDDRRAFVVCMSQDAGKLATKKHYILSSFEAQTRYAELPFTTGGLTTLLDWCARPVKGRRIRRLFRDTFLANVNTSNAVHPLMTVLYLKAGETPSPKVLKHGVVRKEVADEKDALNRQELFSLYPWKADGWPQTIRYWMDRHAPNITETMRRWVVYAPESIDQARERGLEGFFNDQLVQAAWEAQELEGAPSI